MLNITLDLDTGLAKLAAATTIKAGAQVPVTITTVRGATPASPGASPAFELGLGTDAAPPVLKAYLHTFAFENAHTFTGVLDANDTRLVAFMAGKGTVNFGCEVAWTVAGELQVAPSFAVPVQARVIPSSPTSEGGPDYYTAPQVDALLAGLADDAAIFASGNLTGYTGATPASWSIDFATYPGGLYKFTIDGTDYAQPATAAGAAPAGSAAVLPAGWTAAGTGATLLITAGDAVNHTFTVTEQNVPPSVMATGYGDDLTLNTYLTLDFSTWTGARFTLTVDGSDYLQSAADGATHGSAAIVSAAGIAPTVYHVPSGWSVYGVTNSGTIAANDTASSHTASLAAPTAWVPGVTPTAVVPTGNVDMVTLIAGVAGKTLRWAVAGLTGTLPSGVQLGYHAGGSITPCSGVLTPNGVWQNFAPDDDGGSGTASHCLTGIAGADLVAYITGAVAAQAGPVCRIEIHATRL